MASIFRRRKLALLPAGATVRKVQAKSGSSRMVARWTDDAGKTREAEVVRENGKPDRIILREFKVWYVSYEAEDGRRQIKGYTDKAASEALGERLEKEAARRREGLIDRADDELKVPIQKSIDDFMQQIIATSTSTRYVDQVRRRIDTIISETKVTRLHQLDSAEIERFLNEQKLFGHARNEYIGNIKALARWAVETKRLRSDPLATLKKVPRKKIQEVHPRRALSPNELAKLFVAAEERAMLEKKIVRKGKQRGQLTAKVRDWVIQKMTRLGKERRLCYELAALAGLRRSEVKQLKWGDIQLDQTPPQFHLRATATKAKRSDQIVITPELAEALRAFKPKNAGPGDWVVTTVPDMKAFRADLAYAGIVEKDQRGYYADFHSLRKSYNMIMASAKISARVRQYQMRHTDPRLTENTYVDEHLLPITQELEKMSWVGRQRPGDTTAMAPSGAPPGAPGAPAMHRQTVVLALDLSQADASSPDDLLEVRIRGHRSEVEKIQRVIEAMAGKTATRLDIEPGRS